MRAPRYLLALALVLMLGTTGRGMLTEDQVLLVVNGSSEVSAYVAEMYRQYYPGISDDQVIELSGLPDSASPTANAYDEIITRQEYESLIAEPIRQHLINTGLVNDIYCLVTIAGMPYRIEDTNLDYADVVKPYGSDASIVVAHYGQIDAATVEAELALLWQTDPALEEWPSGPRVRLRNRVVNPYQGYRSSITEWSQERDLLNRRLSFRWTSVMLAGGALMEGEPDPSGISALNRLMSPADIYLVVRLDGPRNVGESPIFAVREILDRSARVSDPSHVRFAGFWPSDSAVVFDHAPAAPGGNLVGNDVLNFPPTWDFGQGPVTLWTLSYAEFPVPPTADVINYRDDYVLGFEMLTGYVPLEDQLSLAPGEDDLLGGRVYLDDTSTMMDYEELHVDESLFALATFGKNSDDGRDRHYLKTGGNDGRPLFRMVPGAVFASAESFNAVTMFLNYNTFQGKIVDFLHVGGTGAVGHGFEPMADAIIDTQFLFENLLRDEDGDSIGDMCFAEAAVSAMPYVSWAEVAVGDPLMRLHLGPGAMVYVDAAGTTFEPGDCDGDGDVDAADAVWILSVLNDGEAAFGDGRYDDRADIDRDGYVEFNDLDALINTLWGTDYEALSQSLSAWPRETLGMAEAPPGQRPPPSEAIGGL
ncbi:MAG: hypothetical protein JSU68_00885 [Phycisphaerales bacterium]|nr:MAG: hypothetical protein JSU68_00885 [Phycisphaerales bacterium]